MMYPKQDFCFFILPIVLYYKDHRGITCFGNFYAFASSGEGGGETPTLLGLLESARSIDWD
jgi:hypothetical protein